MKVLITTLVFCFTAFNGISQDLGFFIGADYSLDLGYGQHVTGTNRVGNDRPSSGISLNASLNMDRKNFRLSGFYSKYDEFSVPFAQSYPLEHRELAGVLAGRTVTRKWFCFGMQAGLGLVWGVQRSDFINKTERSLAPFVGNNDLVDVYRSDRFRTASIPGKISFTLTPTKYIGIGASFQADLNLSRNLYAGMIHLRLGMVR